MQRGADDRKKDRSTYCREEGKEDRKESHRGGANTSEEMQEQQQKGKSATEAFLHTRITLKSNIYKQVRLTLHVYTMQHNLETHFRKNMFNCQRSGSGYTQIWIAPLWTLPYERCLTQLVW